MGNLDSSHVAAISVLSEFLAHAQIRSLHHHPPVDVIVLCGNSILPIAEHVFSTLEANPDLAQYLVICGGIGHSTDFLYRAVAAHPRFQSLSESTEGLPEARVLHEILEKFYSMASMTRNGLKILVEDQSTNCGANAIETRRILNAKGVTSPQSIIVVQDPTMSLRTLAAFEKVYSDHDVRPNLKACPTFIPAVSLSEEGELQYSVHDLESASLWTMTRFLDLLMGELPRLRDNEFGYGPKGKNFISHVDIPRHIEEAFKVLQNVLAHER